jgi:hypothetical protein
VQFPGAQNCWHPLRFNELDFTRQERLRQRVHVSMHPDVNAGKICCLALGGCLCRG